MQPFDVRLDYRGRSWCSVRFELGHNEIGDAEGPEYHLAADLAELFVAVIWVNDFVRRIAESRR